MSQVVYLYGFVPPDAPLPPDGLAGVGEQPVELVPLDGFAAAISRLPADSYAPDAIEPQLSDLNWVAERGVQHERVVAWFVDHAQILPVRLLTLYSNEDALRAEAAARAELLRAEMRRFAGLREWDLKVAYRAETLQQHLGEVSETVAELDREIADATPGKRFLLEKKRADLARVETARAARGLGEVLLHALGEHAVQIERVPIPREAAELPVVVNAALLVSSDAEAPLREAVRERAAALEAIGLQIAFSGPWAPYRFLASGDGDRTVEPAAT